MCYVGVYCWVVLVVVDLFLCFGECWVYVVGVVDYDGVVFGVVVEVVV